MGGMPSHFPPELLETGLSVAIQHEFDGELYEGWAEIIETDGTTARCEWSEAPEAYIGTSIDITAADVIRARGSLDWNIENLYVSCSKEVADGVTIGYFYNAFLDIPLHYGRKFYSVNEVDKDKYQLPIVHVPLKTLLEKDPTILPYLELMAYCGVLRDKDGKFRELHEEDISKYSAEIFPCMYELDRAL